MYTGKQYADLAKNPKYDKIKYSEKDCQAFCELVLKDLGVRQPNGKSYDWKGSNDMFRNAVSWVGTIDECRRKFGDIPLGSWAFMWDTSGAEKDRGYYDGKGNASHIGIYIGNDTVRDSTKIKNASGQVIRDGVGTRPIKQFQKIGLCKLLDYAGTNPIINIEVNRDEINEVYKSLQSSIKIIEGWLK